jgi:hypothetical protein
MRKKELGELMLTMVLKKLFMRERGRGRGMVVGNK